jgi:hypothetical protein
VADFDGEVGKATCIAGGRSTGLRELCREVENCADWCTRTISGGDGRLGVRREVLGAGDSGDGDGVGDSGGEDPGELLSWVWYRSHILFQIATAPSYVGDFFHFPSENLLTCSLETPLPAE